LSIGRQVPVQQALSALQVLPTFLQAHRRRTHDFEQQSALPAQVCPLPLQTQVPLRRLHRWEQHWPLLAHGSPAGLQSHASPGWQTAPVLSIPSRASPAARAPPVSARRAVRLVPRATSTNVIASNRSPSIPSPPRGTLVARGRSRCRR
jgi:hypothetical protein